MPDTENPTGSSAHDAKNSKGPLISPRSSLPMPDRQSRTRARVLHSPSSATAVQVASKSSRLNALPAARPRVSTRSPRASAPRSMRRYVNMDMRCFVACAKPIQECFACVEDRLAQDAIDEEVYAGADRDKAFVPEYKAWPSAFDSTRSDDGSSVTVRGLHFHCSSLLANTCRPASGRKAREASASLPALQRSSPSTTMTKNRSLRQSTRAEARPMTPASGKLSRPSPGVQVRTKPPAPPSSTGTHTASLELHLQLLLSLDPCTHGARVTLSGAVDRPRARVGRAKVAGPRFALTYVSLINWN